MKHIAQALSIIAATVVSVLALAYVSTLSAQSPYTHRTTPLSYELLSSSITATGAAGATGLVTLTSDCIIASFENTTNVEIDALIGSTKKRVPATSFRYYDLGANNTRWAAGTLVKVYGNGAAPSTGAFEMLCQPY